MTIMMHWRLHLNCYTPLQLSAGCLPCLRVFWNRSMTVSSYSMLSVLAISLLHFAFLWSPKDLGLLWYPFATSFFPLLPSRFNARLFFGLFSSFFLLLSRWKLRYTSFSLPFCSGWRLVLVGFPCFIWSIWLFDTRQYRVSRSFSTFFMGFTSFFLKSGVVFSINEARFYFCCFLKLIFSGSIGTWACLRLMSTRKIRE